MDWLKRHNINDWITCKTEIFWSKVKLDLSNFVTKTELKNATGVDTSKFPKKVSLGSLKFEVDILDIDKLERGPTGLNSLKSKVDKLDDDKKETCSC